MVSIYDVWHPPKDRLPPQPTASHRRRPTLVAASPCGATSTAPCASTAPCCASTRAMRPRTTTSGCSCSARGATTTAPRSAARRPAERSGGNPPPAPLRGGGGPLRPTPPYLFVREQPLLSTRRQHAKPTPYVCVCVSYIDDRRAIARRSLRRPTMRSRAPTSAHCCR